MYSPLFERIQILKKEGGSAAFLADIY